MSMSKCLRIRSSNVTEFPRQEKLDVSVKAEEAYLLFLIFYLASQSLD